MIVKNQNFFLHTMKPFCYVRSQIKNLLWVTVYHKYIAVYKKRLYSSTYFIGKIEYLKDLMKVPTITNVICSHSHSVCTSYWRAIYGLVIQIRFFTTNLQIYILNRLVSRGKNKDSSIRKPCHNLIICSTYKCVLRWPSTHLWTGRW